MGERFITGFLDALNEEPFLDLDYSEGGIEDLLDALALARAQYRLRKRLLHRLTRPRICFFTPEGIRALLRARLERSEEI